MAVVEDDEEVEDVEDEDEDEDEEEDEAPKCKRIPALHE
jgi:hypothetical protein